MDQHRYTENHVTPDLLLVIRVHLRSLNKHAQELLLRVQVKHMLTTSPISNHHLKYPLLQ